MSLRKPSKVIRIGSVSASIFSIDVQADSGSRTFHTVGIQKRYMVEDKPKYTNSFSRMKTIPGSLECETTHDS